MQAARHFVLISNDIRARCAAYVSRGAPDGFHVLVREPNRTLEQNAAQWPLLEAFAQQLQWPVNGQLCTLTSEEFKDVLTAGFRRESLRLAEAWEGGGVVMLGQRTSGMSKREFGEWLEFLHAAAAFKGIDLDGAPRRA